MTLQALPAPGDHRWPGDLGPKLPLRCWEGKGVHGGQGAWVFTPAPSPAAACTVSLGNNSGCPLCLSQMP